MAKRALLLIHGIESTGDWFEPIVDVCEPHFECIGVKYTQYLHWGWAKLPCLSWLLLLPLLPAPIVGILFLLHRLGHAGPVLLVGALVLALTAGVFAILEIQRRASVLRLIKQRYDQTARQGEPPHVVAHSLGTYVMGRILRKWPDVRYERVVYVGSPLPRDFWNEVIDSKRVGHVRNEVGKMDLVVRLTGVLTRVMPGFGDAGWFGFSLPADRVHALADDGSCVICESSSGGGAFIHNASVGEFTHGDAFIGPGYAERFWLPFLWGISGADYTEFRDTCVRAARLEDEGNWPELQDVESTLRSRTWRLWQCTPQSLNDYVGRYLLGWQHSHGRSLTDKQVQEVVDVALRLTWRAVAQAMEERRLPIRESRRESVLVRVRPLQAVRCAVESALEARGF
ncbi:MAG TPA: hypothetical protein VL332_01970 [Candidatus Saccharimonadaceae bacterium]|jgi:pimeloyl-ACP methyl ester carboxylesterase|nr:hypothetical protein [Candidatus Saccharimonadaceae bacterium]